MTIYFITGNKNKFDEAKSILKDVNLKQLNIDLPEIQEIDSRKIIEEKLKEALRRTKNKKEEFIVEDASLSLKCLNGLPGSLIKWFMHTIGNKGLYEISKKYKKYNAEAKDTIGYYKKGKIYFFEGKVKGKIVKARGKNNFGWDPIFLPNGYNKTFAEMPKEEKNKISHRKEVLEKLKRFLKKK